MKRKTFLGFVFTLVTGVALACSVNAMPPFGVIKVSALSIIQEIKSGDVKGAPYRAFLASLDKRAQALLGTSVWRDNGWKGYVTYSTPAGGINQVYFEKDCGQGAVDRVTEQPSPPNSGGNSARGGGGSSSGGAFVVIGGGCYGNCGGGKPTARVGNLQQI